ncbi:hypothetical protein H5T89_04325, partial [bacterium]|nr:hypothetical protein [bacterium]
NLNLVKHNTDRLVGGFDTTLKLGGLTVGAEYALAMDRTFTPLGADASAMKLTVSIPVGTTLTLNAGYKDIGKDYEATWASYTADRVGYNAGLTVNLGTAFTIQLGYANEKSKSDSGASVNTTGYGVGVKTNFLGTAIQYTSTVDNVAGTTDNLVEVSLAPLSWLKLAAKYDVDANTYGISSEMAVPNLPKVTAYYTPNGTFKYGLAISEYTFANFLTLKAQYDTNPDTNKTQYYIDGKIKLTDTVSLFGTYATYTNTQTSYTAGVNYTYKWSDNISLSIDLKHVVDPFGTEANAFITTVSAKF